MHSSATPVSCKPDPPESSPPDDSWPPYRAGLYFPAGIYRITDTITLPSAGRISQVRLFGDGGRGGGYASSGPLAHSDRFAPASRHG